MATTSALSTAVNILASPAEAFRAIRERPTFLLPFALVAISAAAATWLYLAEVDLGWLTEQQMRSITFIELTEAQIQDRIDAAANGPRGPTIAIGVIGTIFFLTIVFLLQALYLKIVSAFRKDGVLYQHWFSLICWTSLPSVLASIATIIFILTSDVRFVGQTAINPLTFGNLLQVDLSEASGIVTALYSASIINIWSLVLIVLGYRILAKSGIVTALSVVFAPIVAVIAIVLAIVL